MENDTKVRFLCAVTVIGAHLNEHLLFSISNPSKHFQIGSTTGILSTTGIAFDREVKEIYQIIVQVCNNISLSDRSTNIHSFNMYVLLNNF